MRLAKRFRPLPYNPFPSTLVASPYKAPEPPTPASTELVRTTSFEAPTPVVGPVAVATISKGDGSQTATVSDVTVAPTWHALLDISVWRRPHDKPILDGTGCRARERRLLASCARPLEGPRTLVHARPPLPYCWDRTRPTTAAASGPGAAREGSCRASRSGCGMGRR
jgi:hypothetical protein